MKEKKFGLIRMVWHVLSLSFRKCLPLFLAFFALTVGAGLVRAANVFIKQRFFDVIEAVALQTQAMPAAIGWGIALALASVLILLLQGAGDWTQTNYHQTVIGCLGQNLNKKAARVEPVVFEDKRFLDAVNRAYTGLESVMNVAESFLFIAFSEVSYLVAMGAYFFSVKPLLLVPFAFSFVPMTVSALIRRKMYTTMEYKDAPYRRKYEYFGKCISSREYAKETRLWKADGYFARLFRENLAQSSRLRLKTMTRSDLVELGLRFLQLTGYIATVVLLVYYLMRGEVGIGAFAAIFTSLDQMFDRMERIFQIRLPHLMEDLGPAENFFSFLRLKERTGSYDKPLPRREIVLKNVCFAYPGSDRNVLDHIDLTLKKGETVAIVGVNGSGKSTLTRLLIGEYLPTDGTMEIDGINVKDIAPRRIYQGVSAVFQKYQCYKMTVGENTRISDTDKDAPVEPLLEQVSFPLESEKFTDGVDTMLGKDFGGIDLSGGQWQRLAIARGLYRAHDMIVLDEPTAAIDPLEEAKIYRKFAEVSRNKTAVIVTHRLGSVHMADRIIVMDGGKIIDIGQHEQLMEKKGLYYEMYQSQAKWYA